MQEECEKTLQEHFEEKEALNKDIFYLKNDLMGLLAVLPTKEVRSAEEQAALDDTLDSMDFDGVMERLFLLINQIDADKVSRQARVVKLQEINAEGDRKKAALEKTALSLLFASGRDRSGGVEAQRIVKKKADKYTVIDEDKVPETFKEPVPSKLKKAELIRAIKAGVINAQEAGVEVSPGGLTLAKMPKRA